MNCQLTEKKDIRRLVILFTLTYMVSYITRINFGAIVSEIEKSTGILRSALSMALTGSFITYGTGQIVSGILGDRVSPKKLVSIGLIITCAMNVLIPLCPSPYLMLIVWCINGFAQSFMWPPIVRLMTALLSAEDYKEVTTKVLYGSSLGTIAVYLISPLLISLAGWKAVFFFSAASAVIMLIFWHRYSYEIPCERTSAKKTEKSGNNKMLFTPVMLCIMAAIILQGMLRDGVTTWMPTYISDVYDLSNIISILTGVILPVFSILCIKITSKLYMKHFTNPVWCGCVVFGVGAVSALGIYFLSGRLVAFSVLFSALLTGCMHGVNYLLVCMIPAYFKKYGNVSTASGVINSCTYIGSAISTYGIALISERLGWSFTIMTWIIIGVLGTALCLFSFKGWEKKYQ
ncbi:MAG: MFS transporter [Clostridia bacterium]|nr:MFS transporter [Clostridia bacterium]